MSKVSDFPAKIRGELTAVIASAASVSGAVDLVGTGLIAIQMPSAITGNSISFQGSADGTTFGPIYDSTGEAAVGVAASQLIAVPETVTRSTRYIKLVSDVAEGAERTIKLITRPISG